MATRITEEDKININELYLKYKTYAEVARQTGFSPSTVKKYVIPNYIAKDSLQVNKYNELTVSKTFYSFPLDRRGWESLLILTEEEKTAMNELRKEILIWRILQ